MIYYSMTLARILIAIISLMLMMMIIIIMNTTGIAKTIISTRIIEPLSSLKA